MNEKVQLSQESIEQLAKLQSIVNDVNGHKKQLEQYQDQLTDAQQELKVERECGNQGGIMRAVATIQALEMIIEDTRAAFAHRKAYYNSQKQSDTLKLVKSVRSAVEENERHKVADKLERIKALEEEIQQIKNEAIMTQEQVNAQVAPFYDRLEFALAKGTAFDSMISSAFNRVKLFNDL